MKINQYQIFSYKGKIFMINELELNKVSACRMNVAGIEMIAVNKRLPKRKRMLLIHKLVTGRGVRRMPCVLSLK